MSGQLLLFGRNPVETFPRLRVIKMIWFPLLVLITWSQSVSDGANILAIVPTPSFSHQLFYRAYLLELHKRGHNLTVFTTDPLNDPSLVNYREVDLSYLYEDIRKLLDVSSATGKRNRIFAEALFIVFSKIIVNWCHRVLSDPAAMDIYRRNEKFDLFIAEWGVATCFYPFEKLADGKMIGISSFQLGVLPHSTLGGVWNPSYAADPSLEYTDRMTFFQRLRSTIFYWNAIMFLNVLKMLETNIAREYFGPDTKPLTEIEANVSIVFDNSHVTMSYPRANNVNAIPLGGPALHLHGRRPQPLPKEIKNFLDDAPNGVIYFSLGTNVKTNNISNEEEKILMESFSRIKQKVLWKWDNENLKVDLKNVMKRKWFPQVDVLAHPNVKAFVTQGGLQSFGEAIEYHVPLIVMPFFADQNHNARKMEKEGIALYMDFDTLTADSFTKALNEIIHNKKYKENMVKFSALVKDQPIPPIEKAVWWTEYVIRHNGAPHLRSAAATMPWYQYFMLDVLAVVFLGLFLIGYIIYIILRSCLRLVFNTQKRKTD